jgi:hypothetical protein
MHALIAALVLLQAQDHPEPAQARLPQFIMDALASPFAVRAVLYIAKDGSIERSKVVLQRAGMPDWIHEVADRKLGKGDDVSFEAETYPDGSEVYEVTRRVDGRPKKLSVRRDRTVRYVETTVDRASVPPSILESLAKLDVFRPEEWLKREGETVEYHVRGSVAGFPHKARMREDGTLKSFARNLPAEVEVSLTSKPEPAAK